MILTTLFQRPPCDDRGFGAIVDGKPADRERVAHGIYIPLSVEQFLTVTWLLQADKDQRAMLYECIRGHIVTLRGCKTGSKVIWLL